MFSYPPADQAAAELCDRVNRDQVGWKMCCTIDLWHPGALVPRCTPQLYSPSRSLRLVDTPSLLEEVKQNVEGYGKLLLPSLADMEDLAPDSGAICQKVGQPKPSPGP